MPDHDELIELASTLDADEYQQLLRALRFPQDVRRMLLSVVDNWADLAEAGLQAPPR
jgi:hypothetical protein